MGFICKSAKLIVELDDHQQADTEEVDLARTAVLETKGYRVVQFWNDDVYDNLN